MIADGIVAMEGDGPLNGTATYLNTILLSDDPLSRRTQRSRDCFDSNQDKSDTSEKQVPSLGISIVATSLGLRNLTAVLRPVSGRGAIENELIGRAP